MIKLFDKLYKDDCNSLFTLVKSRLLNEEKTCIVTANPEIFMKSVQNSMLVDILLDENTIVTPDGEGIVKAARMLDYEIWGKIAGVDTVEYLLEQAALNDKKVYIYGSKQSVLDAFKEKYLAKYPKLNLCGLKNGYENSGDMVFQDMLAQQPDLILVALGVPRQEIEIFKHFHEFKKGVFLGVGGSIDVLSGTVKRAPAIFINLKLEWLYRIAFDPKRWKRFYNSHVKFIFYIKKLARKK